MFSICKCVCNRVGLYKFFDLDFIGVRFRWNGLWWCCPNFYSFIFMATKQRMKKNWEMILLGFDDGGFGALEFINFFFNGVLMLNFLGLWIWFLGLWILFAGAFVVDWKMRKSGFELRFCISGFCGFVDWKICC